MAFCNIQFVGIVFWFAGGEFLYREAKKRGVLIRHFGLEKILDYNRITIGTREQMEKLVKTFEEILGGIA